MLTYETSTPLRSMALAAAAIERDRGYPALDVLTRWAVESGWGEKETGQYNYWGIKRYPEAGPAKFCATFEDLTGAGFAMLRADEKASLTKIENTGVPGVKRYHLSCWFAAYATFEASVGGYVDFILGNHRYADAWANYQEHGMHSSWPSIEPVMQPAKAIFN